MPVSQPLWVDTGHAQQLTLVRGGVVSVVPTMFLLCGMAPRPCCKSVVRAAASFVCALGSDRLGSARIAYLLPRREVFLELLEGPLEVQALGGVAVVHPVAHGSEHEGEAPEVSTISQRRRQRQRRKKGGKERKRHRRRETGRS